MKNAAVALALLTIIRASGCAFLLVEPAAREVSAPDVLTGRGLTGPVEREVLVLSELYLLTTGGWTGPPWFELEGLG